MKLPLLSFDDAKKGGEAMFERCAAMRMKRPPWVKEDAAWADMFRAGYEAIRDAI